MCYKQWSGKLISDQSCRDVLYEPARSPMVRKGQREGVQGYLCIPAAPEEVSNPVFDEHLPSRIPKEVMKLLPSENVLLAIYIEYEGNNPLVHQVTYYRPDNLNWYSVGNLYDYGKKKWMEGRTIRLYGKQFRADMEHQWWTRAGYERAKADNKLDPQIAAVWSNYMKFYGRDEALCRLGLPFIRRL